MQQSHPTAPSKKRWKESERVQEEGKSDAAIIKTTKITITLKMKHKEKMREIFELVEEKKWERDAVAAACLQHRGACLLLSRKNPIHKQDLKTGDGDWFPERCVCVLYCVYVCEHRIEGKEDMEQEWVWAVEKTQCIPMRVMIWSEWMCRACVCVCSCTLTALP